MADPDDVFAAGNALVLQRNLLERIIDCENRSQKKAPFMCL